MKKNIYPASFLLAMIFPCLTFASSNGVQLIKNARGIESCPENTFCVYTNANYNNNELGDILSIHQNIQLNSDELNSFGFPVGEHNGVSSVVNKMSTEGTLVRGINIDGDFLPVEAGENKSNLVSYGWNDSTNSIVTKKVIPANIRLSLPDKTIYIGENDYATLNVSNSSNEDIELEMVVEGTPGILTALDYENKFIVPAQGYVNEDILLSGERVGEARLVATIKPEIGVINQSSNVATAKIDVEEWVVPDLNITQSFKTKWQTYWPEEGWDYTYHLVLRSEIAPVKHWKFSFVLPDGAHVTEQWLDSQSSWLKLNEEESVDGKVVLENISGNVISPESSIPLDIEVFYLDEKVEHEKLHDLILEEIE
jgi:hypothetical protein